MAGSELQPRGIEGHHLLLFDGVCGLCSRLVQFVLVRDRRRVFHFASLQSARGAAALAHYGHDAKELTTVYVLANYGAPDATLLTKARAVLFVAGALGWPWKAARLFGVLPIAWLDLLYDFVARNRYRVFGRLDHCLMASPQYRSRFVDSQDIPEGWARR
jgi:predicted DCC family thiol-disulfide oxidoreductase YuxK